MNTPRPSPKTARPPAPDLTPLSPEEAERELERLEALPLPEEQIRDIVRTVTKPGTKRRD